MVNGQLRKKEIEWNKFNIIVVWIINNEKERNENNYCLGKKMKEKMINSQLLFVIYVREIDKLNLKV